MLSPGHKLSKKYATNGIIDSEYIDSYAYIFDYIFNFALYNFTLILIGFILHKSAITITYVIIIFCLLVILSLQFSLFCYTGIK